MRYYKELERLYGQAFDLSILYQDIEDYGADAENPIYLTELEVKIQSAVNNLIDVLQPHIEQPLHPQFEDGDLMVVSDEEYQTFNSNLTAAFKALLVIAKEKGISARKLAELIGTNEQQFSRAKKGKIQPQFSWFAAICKLLQINYSYNSKSGEFEFK